MYYYKSKIETFENGKIVVRFEQKRSTEKRIYIVELDTIGGLNRTHKIMAVNAANERIQAGIMQIAYNVSRSEAQRNERRNKR